MLQVRWQLNAVTQTKKKTLACDYNPIHKRLRDFGAEAQELETLPNGDAVVKPLDKGDKRGNKAGKAAAGAKPPSTDAEIAMLPVTLQSIVAELEGAGLLRNLDGAAVNSSATSHTAATHEHSTRSPRSGSPAATEEKQAHQLSLGAAGLLSAAGLLPEDSALPISARSLSSDAVSFAAKHRTSWLNTDAFCMRQPWHATRGETRARAYART